MFDSFIFLPSPNYLYDYAPGDSDGRKPMNKTEWQEYIEGRIYAGEILTRWKSGRHCQKKWAGGL